MNRLATLALLCLAACATELSPSPEAEQPRELWLEHGALGWEEQQAWGLPLPQGFGVSVAAPDVFLANCNAIAGDCSERTLGFVELAEDRVWLRGDLSGDRLHSTLLHEMGHILRGEGGHLPGEGDVMSELETGMLQPTPADYDFVLGLDRIGG
jgi:hypothetical protein